MKRRDFIVSSVAGSVGATLAHAPIAAASSEGEQVSPTTTRKILIAGGNYNTAFIRYMAQLTGKPRPKLLYLPTASADSQSGIINWYRACAPLNVEPSHQISFIASTSQPRTWEEVLLAVDGHSRLARTPVLRADDNVVEVTTHAEISDDGHITGTTSERATGAMASDLKAWMALDLDEARATKQLNFFDGPGTGKWLDPVRNDAANDVSLKSEFAMADTIDLAAGEALVPPPGLRFLARPGTMLMGTHDTPRTHPFPCYAGRQVETLDVAVPAGFRPQRLPRNRTFETAMATYSARYAFHDGTLTVRREFVARPRQQVCTAEQSHEMADLLSRIRRDYASVVLFDRAL